MDAFKYMLNNFKPKALSVENYKQDFQQNVKIINMKIGEKMTDIPMWITRSVCKNNVNFDNEFMNLLNKFTEDIGALVKIIKTEDTTIFQFKQKIPKDIIKKWYKSQRKLKYNKKKPTEKA